MVSFLTLLYQKLLPNAKKSLWIKVRKKSGAWRDFLLAPSKNKFKADGMTYMVIGKPDIDDFTNQRVYTFLQGVSTPVKFDETHPQLITANQDLGNMDMLLDNAEMDGFMKAGLLKKKSAIDPLWLILIGTAIIVVFHTLMLMSIMDKLGVKLM